MSFSNLTPADRDAFFALLDELSIDTAIILLVIFVVVVVVVDAEARGVDLAHWPPGLILTVCFVSYFRYFTSRPNLIGGLNGFAPAKGANGPPGRPAAVGTSPPQNTPSNNDTASGSPPLVPTWKRPSQDVSVSC